MDEENEKSFFSDFQKDQLNQDILYESLPDLDFQKQSESYGIENITLRSRQPSMMEPFQPSPYIKAFNPMEMIEKMAPQKKKQYERIATNSKNFFSGLQFFFQTEQENPHQQGDQTFLSGINEAVFNYQHEPKSGELDKLFSINGEHESQKQHIQNVIIQLRMKMNETQQKSFSSIMLNKTIGPAFYEHFENFSFVSNPSNFFQDLEVNLTNFINHAKRLKGPGPQLIYSIYDFWIKTFKDFVNDIWKYSSKYTLNFLKKQKNSEISDRSDSTTNAKKQALKDKRKNWSSQQIRILEKIIDSNIIFSQTKLKQLSEELGRSVNSISSKIQKIIKSKKGEQYQQESLLKKTIQVLKLFPEGLNKQLITQKINEYYEMGYDGQWQKSVGQLLSSRKEFNKIKGKYKLLNGEFYLKNTKMEDQNLQKLTFRDKVIKCLLRFDRYEADLKSIIEMYITFYGEQEAVGNSIQERRKSIEASISKTLSRYDIFDTSCSKTIYQYVGGSCQSQQKLSPPLEEYEYFITM